MPTASAVLQPEPQPSFAPSLKTGTLALVLFCAGHFFIDLYSSALGVLQPLLITQFGLTFTQAGLLGGLLSFSSSVTQPIYGFLSDRFHSKLFTALAPAVAAVFISSLGWAPSFPMLLAMVFLGGAGIASFHPQATSNATVGVSRNRARAMAVFISSGTLGMALGPTFFSLVTGAFGLKGSYGAAVPGVLLSLLLLVFLKPPHRVTHRTGLSWAPLRAVWKPMTILYFLVFIRSIIQITFAQFLPLYLHTQRGYSLPRASYALTAYMIGGALGGMAGGHLADRFGGRRVIILSMAGCLPFLALFLFTGGMLSLAGLVLAGVTLLFTIPVNVVMAQQLAPGQTGTVSALMMGFAWGMAGILFIPLTGWISDHYSMQAAFSLLCAFPVIGIFLARSLPE